MFPARVGLTIAEIDEFATLEPICFIPPDDDHQDPDPKTPKKKKAAADPPTTVVSSIRRLVFEV